MTVKILTVLKLIDGQQEILKLWCSVTTHSTPTHPGFSSF